MKSFKEYNKINEAKYYLEVDNSFDATRDASNEEGAVKALFPKAKKISFVGVDDPDGYDVMIYGVVDSDGERHNVKVSRR